MIYGKEEISKKKETGRKAQAYGARPFAYILSDVKETVVTENYYQPIPASILKYFMPKGMMK